jgi:hypothetical protein
MACKQHQGWMVERSLLVADAWIGQRLQEDCEIGLLGLAKA